MAPDREFELVLWGATGYTGGLVAEYLAGAPSAQGLRWALAGRSREKLERVRAGLAAERPHLAALPLLVADAFDPKALDDVARRARVICTTVGPYGKYGSELVAACVRNATHYCDLTGEVPWIRRMIDTHHDAARASGTRIVHCCGFDSIPSDLGVLMLHEAMRERGKQLARVDAYFGESKGFISGGTFASMVTVVEAARRDRQVRRLLVDPYGLDPTPGREGPDGRDPMGVHYEPRLGRWSAPYVMAGINTRVVRRTNAITDYRYGEPFRYTERLSLPGGAKGWTLAAAVTGAHAALVPALITPPLRRLLQRRLPTPGEGPGPHKRASGYFVVRLLGESEERSPLPLLGRVEDRRDPGYGSTSVMLAESTLCLARDALSSPGGVLTPASAMGMQLVERLRQAGMRWEVQEAAPPHPVAD